uniref:Uncharacterized protein n=1 Tax=Peronospora matthiolae TaxID=2874970 RepID=A0AAV1T3H9_9STRA
MVLVQMVNFVLRYGKWRRKTVDGTARFALVIFGGHDLDPAPADMLTEDSAAGDGPVTGCSHYLDRVSKLVIWLERQFDLRFGCHDVSGILSTVS